MGEEGFIVIFWEGEVGEIGDSVAVVVVGDVVSWFDIVDCMVVLFVL